MPSRIQTPLKRCAVEDVQFWVKRFYKESKYAPRILTTVCSENEKGKIGVCLVRYEQGGSLTLPSGKLHRGDELLVATRRMLCEELSVKLPNATKEWSPSHALEKYFLHDVPLRAPQPFKNGKAYFLSTQWVASPRDVKKILPYGAENPAIELTWLYGLGDIRHAMADVRDEVKREAILDAVTESLHHWHAQREKLKFAA